MSRVNLAVVITTLAVTVVPSLADSTSVPARTPAPARVQSDRLFDDIMSSLPGDVRAKVDSAKTVQPAQTKKAGGSKAPAPGDRLTGAPTTTGGSNESMNALPEELRRQVEAQIQEIEKRRKEREVQFREMQEQQHQDPTSPGK